MGLPIYVIRTPCGRCYKIRRQRATRTSSARLRSTGPTSTADGLPTRPISARTLPARLYHVQSGKAGASGTMLTGPVASTRARAGSGKHAIGRLIHAEPEHRPPQRLPCALGLSQDRAQYGRTGMRSGYPPDASRRPLLRADRNKGNKRHNQIYDSSATQGAVDPGCRDDVRHDELRPARGSASRRATMISTATSP